ncbi:hypothetical protein M408DRAFT_23547 [Serendipita vermifera MAFF 305830]|uniref:cAMP-independent regulatory protein pac2 n=1 Tax=Serendipita vermifera MAFF 305830 TaxID=933852 RepID=A0A0C2WRV7_SERVB|nr:hypothetical protein M408DRAFT_23547 [Serendipita vermifera MAFF 305830]
MHQRPTHSRLHVRDVRDALILLEAVRLGILKQVSRRLNDAERSMYVRSGSVFVWEENEDDAGIKRWTDGCMWSQSRMREPFLFYEEKLLDDRIGAAAKGRSNNTGESSTSSLGPLTPASRPTASSMPPYSAGGQAFGGNAIASLPEGSSYGPGLVKQAYSAYVTQPGTSIRRKFHLTAYFTYADLPNLPTLESEPHLWNIVIPQGVYRSGKSRTSGRNLANAAEPVRTRQQPMDSSPSPTSSPSSIGHSPSAQWPHARRGSVSYFDPSDGSHSSGSYHTSSVNHSPYIGNPGNPLVTGSRGHPHPGSHTAVARLPPVPSLPLDADGQRRNRYSEDDRVINMLNSRAIP